MIRNLERRTMVGGLLGVVLLAGCAYYNTLYNAKETFNDAERSARAREARAVQPGQAAPTESGTPNPQAARYEDVVEKCKRMIATYPDSKHVDDAMLLSARALFRLGRYDEAVAALDTLETRFPESGLMDDAVFWKGKAFAAEKKYAEAVPVLTRHVESYSGHDGNAESLYLLCTSLMQIGLSDEAVATLRTLEKEHGRSEYRFRAQVDMAQILSEKGMYDESLEVYRRLSASRIPEAVRYDVWIGMATVQTEVGDYQGALETLEGLRTLPRAPDKEPVAMLLRARSRASLDSTTSAVAEYREVTRRYARGLYAAEAYFRLGELYEGVDSLQAAELAYQEVPRAYSGSEFADEAIKRSSSISRVLRLERTAGDDSPEAVAMRTFSMAEIQLLQFASTEKAIPSYEKIVTDFPDSEYAPRAAYALGYIHGVMLGDTARAREWYDTLRTRYPDSAQTRMASAFYHGAPPPPPVSDMIRESALKTSAPTTERRGSAVPPRARRAAADSAATAAPDTVSVPGTVADSTAAPADTATVPADTSAAPADTTAAPADSSNGGSD